MNITPITSNKMSFGARLNSQTRKELNNEEFAQKLETAIAQSDVLNKFNSSDDEILIKSVVKYDSWGDDIRMLATILKTKFKGKDYEINLGYGYQHSSITSNDSKDVHEDVGKSNYYQSIILDDIQNTDKNESRLKAQILEKYVKNYMRNISCEEAAKVYDKIANGEY